MTESCWPGSGELDQNFDNYMDKSGYSNMLNQTEDGNNSKTSWSTAQGALCTRFREKDASPERTANPPNFLVAGDGDFPPYMEFWVLNCSTMICSFQDELFCPLFVGHQFFPKQGCFPSNIVSVGDSRLSETAELLRSGGHFQVQCGWWLLYRRRWKIHTDRRSNIIISYHIISIITFNNNPYIQIPVL